MREFRNRQSPYLFRFPDSLSETGALGWILITAIGIADAKIQTAMKFFLLFYAVTGLLLIIGICRAASRNGARQPSPVVGIAGDSLRLRNARLQNSPHAFSDDTKFISVYPPQKLNFHQESSLAA
jgi:hypothetical protein